jgi:hypothetical protein
MLKDVIAFYARGGGSTSGNSIGVEIFAYSDRRRS